MVFSVEYTNDVRKAGLLAECDERYVVPAPDALRWHAASAAWTVAYSQVLDQAAACEKVPDVWMLGIDGTMRRRITDNLSVGVVGLKVRSCRYVECAYQILKRLKNLLF